ncbi:immunoglobulin domain-containing protein, partial [Cloacibacterium rupense]
MKKNLQSCISFFSSQKKKLYFFILFLITHFFYTQTSVIITKTGDNYWTVPCDVTSITLEVWGAGGGGQAVNGTNVRGAGGAGGGFVKTTYTVVPGQTYRMYVGSGGTGNDTRKNGEGSWFDSASSVFAVGGTGAGLVLTSGLGTGAASLTTGNIGGNLLSTYGGNGANGFDDGTTKYSGGGGSSAGDVNGNNASGITGGTAPTNGYKGGDGRNSDNAGVAGGVGAGGSGAFRNSTTTLISGGNGGNGQVKITYTSYCTKYFNTQVAPITKVTFAGIDNSSSATVNSTTPFNEIFCMISASVQQGMPYNITLKGNSNGNNTDYYRVYIDWDQNKVFGNNVNEVYDIGTITNSTGIDAKVVTGIIDVPSNAVLGSTMMRIVKLRGAYTDACTAANIGQSEDYQVNINIQSPCSGTPPAGSIKLSASSGTPGATFFASIIGSVSGNEFSYQWQKSPDNVNWVDISGANSETANITAEALGVTYYYRRVTTCKNTGDYSISTSASYTGAYCIPTFVASNTGKLFIKSFRFVGVLNDELLYTPNVANLSTQSGANGAYQDFTALNPVATQSQGSIVNLEAISGGNIVTPAKGRWVAWVDWNRDGDFSSSELVYLMDAGYRTESVTFGFPIPNNLPLGDYRLRIAVVNNTAAATLLPCDFSTTNGEVEDYIFRVIEDNLAKLNTDQPNVFHRCEAGEISLTAIGKDANVVNYKWYDAKYGGNLLHTGATFTTNVSATTNFYVTAVDVNGKETPFRYPFVARIDPKPEVTFTPVPQTICGEDDPYLILSVWGDKREEILIDEKFDSGLGAFVNVKEDVFTDTKNTPIYSPDWVTNPNFWKPTGSTEPTRNYYQAKKPPHLAIASTISSGYFGGYFAAINTDVYRDKNIKRHLVATQTFDTTPFLTNSLKLDFDLYYFSIATLKADGYLSVEYSTDNTNWVPFKYFVLNHGNPLTWEKVSLNLDNVSLSTQTPVPAYHAEEVQTVVPRSSTLKIRFSVFSRGFTPTPSYFESFATIDNIKLYGDVPFQRDFQWSGLDNAVLYDETCTTPLGNTLARTVCVKPPLDEFEKPYWEFNAYATFLNGCPAINTTRVYNDTKIWNQPGKTDWKQGNDWKPTGVPDHKKCVIVRTPLDLPQETNGSHGLARSVIVKPGGKLIIHPKSSLTIQNYIKNEATADDVSVESDANLIQVNNAGVNIGNITVKRNANLKRNDYNYWGTPVAAQNLKAFSPGTLSTRFYTYNENNDYFVWIDPNANSFSPGLGYAIRAFNTYPSVAQEFNGKFVGVPNNGVINSPLIKSASGQGYNLVANPYPSNINFYQLYNLNSSLIYNTAYFWTNTNFNPKMQGSSYPSNLPSGTQIINNYAILNGTGGVAAPYAAGTGNNDPIGSPSNCFSCKVPNEYIKVGQGFIVKAKTSGNLRYENGNNIRNNEASSIFFNRMSLGKTAIETKDRFWVSLKTPLDFVSPILIGYVKGATLAYEPDFDAKLL